MAYYPGLKQRWAEIGQRLRRFPPSSQLNCTSAQFQVGRSVTTAPVLLEGQGNNGQISAYRAYFRSSLQA